ncbi:MAG: tetratricopeptide repeat protein, partial [Alkalispirochaeta sp.]
MAIFLVTTVFLSCADSVPVHATESGTPALSRQPELVITSDAAAAAWYAGDHDIATEIYRRLVADHPERDDYRLSLVIVLREQGMIDEAIRYSAGLTGPYAVEHEMNLALAGVPLGAPGIQGGSGDQAESSDQVEPTDHAESSDQAESSVPAESVRSAGSEIAAGDRSPLEPQVSDISRRHFWRGVRAVLASQYLRGTELFARAIETADEGHYPYARYALGRLAAGQGDFEGAVTAYRSALEEDRNLTEVFVPLAQALWELGEYRAAWDRMERARIALPWNDAIPAMLAAWETVQPSLTAGDEERAQARRVAAIPPRVTAVTEEYREGEVLRVGLVENLDSVYLKTGGPFVLSSDGAVVYDSGESAGATILHVAAGDGEISVTVEGGETLYRGADAVRLGYRDRTWTTTIFDMTYGH